MAPSKNTKQLSNPRWVAIGATAIFILGVLGYLLAQLGVVVLPMRDRSVPVEADDAYTYIIKAKQMQTCFLQDCPALEDLHSQLTMPTNDKKAEWLRYREYSRAFLVYHPLHSVIMVGLEASGLSWEQAYNVIAIAGVILIGLAIAVWLYQLWGAGPAGCAMAFMALTLFAGQGLHYIVPSNLALGIAIFTWGMIAARRSRSIWFMLFGVIAMIGMHSTGRLYAVATLMIYFLIAMPFIAQDFRTASDALYRSKDTPKSLLSKIFSALKNQIKRLSSQQRILFTVAVCIIGLAFILPIFISSPELSIRADPPPANWKSWHGYRDNLAQAYKIITDWMKAQNGALAACTLLAIGILSTPKGHRKMIGIFLAILGLLSIASLLFVLPRYPGDAFSRVWIPFAILLFGFIGQATWAWLISIITWFTRLLNQKRCSLPSMPELIDPAWILTSYGWTSIALVIMGVFIIKLGAQRLTTGADLLIETARIMTWKQNTTLDANQPAMLLEQGCAPVLYLDEVPMHFYFSRGAMDCPAVYYPALEGTHDSDTWIEQNKDLQYIVGWNSAVESGLLTGGSTMALMPGDRLEMHSGQKIPLDQISLHLQNPGAPITLTIIPVKNGVPSDALYRSVDSDVIKLDLPGNHTDWYTLPVTSAVESLSEGFILHTPDPGHRILVKGLRVPGSQNGLTRYLNWPWDQQITLIYTPKGASEPARTIEFDTSPLVKLVNRPVRILDDQGDTYLAEVEK